MLIAIIPDLHGRKFWKELISKEHLFDKIVALGDYVDPYQYEGITPTMALENFEEFLDWAEENKDKVTLLKGNHDEFYLSGKECCRHDYFHTEQISQLYKDYNYLFKYACKIDNYLFTHAGVSTQWIEENGLHYLNEDTIVEYLNSSPKTLWQIGRSRGGHSKTGSPIWCCIYGDWIRPWVKSPFDCYQVFGHTQMKNDGQKYKDVNRKLWGLDSRVVFVLDTETNKVKQLKLWLEQRN